MRLGAGCHRVYVCICVSVSEGACECEAGTKEVKGLEVRQVRPVEVRLVNVHPLSESVGKFVRRSCLSLSVGIWLLQGFVLPPHLVILDSCLGCSLPESGLHN